MGFDVWVWLWGNEWVSDVIREKFGLDVKPDPAVRDHHFLTGCMITFKRG